MSSTSQPGQTQPTIEPHIAMILFSDVLETLPLRPGMSPQQITQAREATLLLAASFRPRDVFEAAQVASIVAAHQAKMECFRCAALPDTPHAVMIRLDGKACALNRMMLGGMDTLRLRQAQQLPVPVALSAGIVAAAIAHAPPIGGKDPMQREQPRAAAQQAMARKAADLVNSWKDPMQSGGSGLRCEAVKPMQRLAQPAMPSRKGDPGFERLLGELVGATAGVSAPLVAAA